jgi:lysophospholipase L1-like esterase
MDRRFNSAGGRVAQGLALLILGIGPGANAGASPIQIMPLGDSITSGFSRPSPVPGGYRGTLYRDLTGDRFNVRLVGSLASNPDSSLPTAARGHEGHIGYLIAGNGAYSSFSLAGHIDKWLAPHNGVDPKFVLLEIGSNEIIGDYHKAQAPREVAALVTRIVGLRPRAGVLLSTITPLADPVKEAEVQAFNRALGGPDGVVAQLRRRGEKVVLVDAGGSLTTADLSPDGIHPTAAGYAKLGHAWAQAIEPLLTRPSPAPEPSTLAVLACGCLGLLAVARPKARTAAKS